MLFLNILLLIAAFAIAIPAGMFCLEVLLAVVCRWSRVPRPIDDAPVPTFAVLIPAHNEQAVIQTTLQTLLPTIPAGSRVVVIADNCSDNTATIARECGATAIERCDASRRGKGFALDFGIAHLMLI